MMGEELSLWYQARFNGAKALNSGLFACLRGKRVPTSLRCGALVRSLPGKSAVTFDVPLH